MNQLLTDSFWNARRWDDNTYDHSKEMPLMSGLPTISASALLTIVVTLKLWPHNQHKASQHVKPFLLVQNGLLFGFHGVGLALALAIFNLGIDCFSCQVLQAPQVDMFNLDYIVSEGIVHGSFLWLFVRIYILVVEPLLVTKATGRLHVVSSHRLLNDLTLVTMLYLGLRFLPTGPAALFAITNLAYYTYRYGYYTLKSGLMMDKATEAKAVKFDLMVRLFWSMALIGHYLIMTRCTQTINMFGILTLQACYALATFLSVMAKCRRLLVASNARAR